jgi:hypothetical protein
LVTAVWKNPTGPVGHVASVAPFDGKYNPSAGPMVAHIGGSNGIKDSYRAFGIHRSEENTASQLSDVKYYFDPQQLSMETWNYKPELIQETIK